jgi:hypothetical protein
MTIYWDFDTETVSRTDEDGTQTTSERRGDLRIWCHYSTPGIDSADQRIDWRARGMSVSTPQVPRIVKTEAVSDEVDRILSATDPDLEKAIRVLRDASTEDIERR